ncbi:MAG: hypothetical protein WBG30_08720 [Psychrilyobacter sp.]|uniref:hypothetical protein n=1 Tax=Psychrilyobacter sp. TaxID=2586924 RepID=UPI003C7188C5
MREIYFAIGEAVLQLPYVNEKIEVSESLNTEEFETVEGKTLTLVGETGNRSLSINSFFPTKRYKWLSLNSKLSTECLDFFRINRKKVLRIVYVDGEETLCNMLCTISNYTVAPKSNGDYNYSLEIKEYVDPKEVS